MEWAKIGDLMPDESDAAEQMKLILRHLFPSMTHVLSCKYCGMVWPEGEVLAGIQEHMRKEHMTDKIELNMVWIGVGPAPKGGKRAKRRNP